MNCFLSQKQRVQSRHDQASWNKTVNEDTSGLREGKLRKCKIEVCCLTLNLGRTGYTIGTAVFTSSNPLTLFTRILCKSIRTPGTRLLSAPISFVERVLTPAEMAPGASSRRPRYSLRKKGQPGVAKVSTTKTLSNDATPLDMDTADPDIKTGIKIFRDHFLGLSHNSKYVLKRNGLTL